MFYVTKSLINHLPDSICWQFFQNGSGYLMSLLHGLENVYDFICQQQKLRGGTSSSSEVKVTNSEHPHADAHAPWVHTAAAHAVPPGFTMLHHLPLLLVCADKPQLLLSFVHVNHQFFMLLDAITISNLFIHSDAFNFGIFSNIRLS